MIVAFRAPGYHPPFRTEPSRLAGRYHGAGDDAPTQYLALHPLGPLAEWLRWNDPPRIALDQLATTAWAVRVPEEGLVRVTFATAAEHGVAAADLVADDHAACRALAARVRAGGARGLVVPSAALPGAENVVLFGERLPVGYLDDVVDPDLDLPAGITARPAGAPAALYDLVRRRHEPHAALDAFLDGRSHRLADELTWF